DPLPARRLRLGLLRRRGGILGLVAPIGLELLLTRSVDRLADPGRDCRIRWSEPETDGLADVRGATPGRAPGRAHRLGNLPPGLDDDRIATIRFLRDH